MSKEQQKTMSVLLVVSLCLNLFLGGLILGGAVMKHRVDRFQPVEEFAPPIRSFLSPREIIRQSAPETREKLKGLAFRDLDELRPSLESVHAARVRLYDLLAAEQLDEEAVRQAVIDLAKAERDVQVASSKTMIKMMLLMTPEERERLMKLSEKPWHHDRHHRDEHRGRWEDRHDDDDD
ncbi:MAG: periplasmic heavy metal sensor [Alphaproteobacteria bacterium]|nr:MAG: periplasmic heavy metal sensor [Alphaproteobacteria bacterium]